MDILEASEKLEEMDAKIKFEDFIKELQEIFYSGKIKEIKSFKNDMIPQGELIITYNPQ